MFNGGEEIYLPFASASHPTKKLEPSFMMIEASGLTKGDVLLVPSLLVGEGRACGPEMCLVLMVWAAVGEMRLSPCMCMLVVVAGFLCNDSCPKDKFHPPLMVRVQTFTN